jgi:hypothetical protein
MEKHQAALESAKRNLAAADHMLRVTYRFINDPRILISVSSKLMAAMTDTMSSILFYEKYRNKIPPFHEDFDSMFCIFRARLSRRYSFSRDYAEVMQKIKELIEQHRKSPIEFSRDGKFVICSDTYRLNVVSDKTITVYLEKAKIFIKDAENMQKIGQ